MSPGSPDTDGRHGRGAAVFSVVLVVSVLAVGLVGGAADPSGGEGYAALTAGVTHGTVPDAAPSDANVEPSASSVRVGVIGSAFDPSHPAIAGHVAGYQRLEAGSVSLVGGTKHDTAVAEIVAERSESASLYLVSVGRQTTPEEYARAVDWLLANDVDVIVDAGSYFPTTASGMRLIADAAERAADSGAVFVTSAGNYAHRHWQGTPADDGWVSFAPGTQVNPLGDGVVSGRVTLRLYWTGEANYDLYLYRDVPGPSDPVVAKSVRTSGSAEAIDAVLPRGHYYVGIYARDGNAPVDLFSAHHRLAYAGANGSAVAPATAAGVISVGALSPGGTVRAYSAGDSDVRAVDGVATDAAGRLRGTSAAAPVVAGAVVAMEAEAGTLSPAEVERILQRTADGETGRVDPAAALAAAANETRNATRSSTLP